jgi:hypothetical protein
MADLLAIISEDRSRLVSVADLRGDYEALRGGASTVETASAGWAEVAVLDHPRPASVGIVRAADGGWTAWAGSLVAPGELEAPGPVELEGQFALVGFDAGAATLTVATDSLGLKPLYLARAGGLAYASTSVLALARHLRLGPSRLGVESFLRLGNQFGPGTPWEGVERLQPAEAVTFSAGGSDRSVYWQPGIDPEVRRLGLRETAEACAEETRAAFAARYGGAERPPWADLTGGFDTRLLDLLAGRAGIRFEANTVGDESSEDVQIAAELARAGGWPWTRLDLPADWAELLPGRLAEAVAWSDCNLDALQLAEVLEGHRAKAASGTALLTGGGGEHYRDYPWAQELWKANRSNRVDFDRLLSWRLLGPLDVSVFRRDPTAAALATRREALEARVAPFAGERNTFQCDLLYALKSAGHGGAYQAAAGAWVHMEIPFYLRSVFSAAISAAPRHRNFHRLMREMIAQLDPRLAAIRTETGGPAEPVRLGNLPRFAPYVGRRATRFGYRLRGRVLGEVHDPRPANPRELARGSAVAALRAAGKLDPKQMRSAALYDPARLEQVLAAAVAAPASADWALVSRVITVELALEAVDAAID